MPLKYSFEVINIVQFLFKMDGAAGVGRKSINLHAAQLLLSQGSYVFIRQAHILYVKG